MTTQQPPTFKESKVTERDIIKRMYSYNVKMTELMQRAGTEMGTDSMEKMLESLSMMMVGNYEGQEAVAVPVDVLRQMSLFATVSTSRQLWEMYKLEKKLGRKIEGTKEDVVVDLEVEKTPEKELDNQPVVE
jgi:hypothetical protein